MKQSQIFTKTLRKNPKDEISLNAQLLRRGGFIYKNSAGVYTFLPLGWRVIQKIANIIREEMEEIGGIELFMPALVEKKYLEATGRWDVEIGFEVTGKKKKNPGFVLGWTHEEILAEMASKFINSYEDLPFYAYQIQTKFRNEPRAKSGLLRGREFLMKDLYSFHETEECLFRYYERVKRAYFKIFDRCGLKSICVSAAGGDFTVSNTHEFQVELNVGEDEIILCRSCNFAENIEISKNKEGSSCSKCGGILEKTKTSEVGNIFPLGNKYSKAFNLKYLTKKGEKKLVVMGSYGIGISRVMGTVCELFNDKLGIIWPHSIAPFRAHLITVGKNTALLQKRANEIYNKLINEGEEVLFDDRDNISAGQKFADGDLIGIPWRLIISEKTISKNKIEIKNRAEEKIKLIELNDIKSRIKN